MFFIPLVILLGTGFNAANAGAHDLPTFEASIVQQVMHPVVVPDYSHLNK